MVYRILYGTKKSTTERLKMRFPAPLTFKHHARNEETAAAMAADVLLENIIILFQYSNHYRY